MSAQISIEKINDDLSRLSRFTSSGTGTTRRAFSPEFADARDWWRARLEREGFSARIDGAGNQVGRRGPDGAPTLILGSHLDTVHQGGDYDGILGVVAGLEVGRLLADEFESEVAIEVVDFLSEEVSDFGLGCIGSRGAVGLLSQDQLALTHPRTAETLADALKRVGGNADELPNGRWATDIIAFLELHIEQGPQLEVAGAALSSVTAIVGARRWSVVVLGEQGHAGTTPMSMRRDALQPAAEIVQGVRRMADSLGEGFVATIGKLDVSPNSTNVIAGRVELMIDARSISESALEKFELGLTELLGSLRSDAEIECKLVSMNPPTLLPEAVREPVERAIEALGYPVIRLPSGAGHDSAYMSRIAPTGMIFVRSRGGVSHAPDEYSSPQDILAGAEALLRTGRSLIADHFTNNR